ALGGHPNPNVSFGVFLDPTGLLNGAGDNSTFQMGDGTNTNYAALMAIGSTAYTAISTRANDTSRGDANFVCAIRETDMKVECWGAASRGQTGASNTTTPTMTPNEVANLSGCTA